MSYLGFYFQAHQPRRLKKKPTLADPFDDVLDRQVFHKVADKCYLPANDLFARLVELYPRFRVCLSVTGTLLEQARRFRPEVIASFQNLARLGRETGRVEFLAETYYHSLAGLFADPNKEEFKAQIALHSAQMHDLLGVTPTAMRNTELLYNNGIGATAAALGFKAILCEKRSDMIAGKSPNSIFADRQNRIKVIPRNDGLSDELAFRFTHRHFTAHDFASWISLVDGECVLIGMDYEAIGEHQWRDTGIFEFWKHLPDALDAHPNVLIRNPSEIAEAIQTAPIADIGDLATSSWADVGRNTNAWLGNRAQQELFAAYQALETTVKRTGDQNLLETWRHLGTSDHFYYMCTTRHGADGGVHEYFSHFGDTSEAVMAYTSLLTRLDEALRIQRKAVQVTRRARRPRILLVTPEVTDLPTGFGNLANIVRAKGGGLADISAALVTDLLQLGLDVHVALPKYERQMCEQGRVSQSELDRLVDAFRHSSRAIHLAQDPAFNRLRDVYESHGQNTALHRAIAFQRVVINQILGAAMPEHGKMLVHCNDWMTGLIPAAAQARGLHSVFTLHNIHSDKTTLRHLEASGVDVARFWQELYLEHPPGANAESWDAVSVDFLLSGIKAAGHVNTVSPSFLLEIINGYFPEIIDWRVREELRSKYKLGCASGILNAPRSGSDPRICRDIDVNYDESTVLEGKRENKLDFQRQMGLEVNGNAPLFFWPHRLYHQKGPALLEQIALSLIGHYWTEGVQIALVGNGDSRWEDAFGAISCGSNGRIAYQRFDPSLSELGKAAADFILMPSLYEPCGLPQMEGLRYGTLPVVRAVGGLKDTVQHLDIERNTGNGFIFNDFVPDALWWAIAEAMSFQRLPPERKRPILERIMVESMETFNLRQTTLRYVHIYERLLGEKLL